MEELKTEKLVVEYLYTYEESKEIERKPPMLILLVWLIPTIFLISLFFLEYFFGDQKFNFFSLSTIGFLLFFFMVFVSFYITNPETVWKSVAQVPKDRRVTFENWGILLETPYSHIQCPWSWVKNATEMKKTYVINTVIQQVAIVIPKGSLKKNEELLLRELIASHVLPKKIKFKKIKLE
ncbi:MAG TPA: hypothetical protein VMX55_00980 [candidate division Zixibacteria bacterium]|nr:hypothetical protein [candidate division Zixibacteria bacterium]